jgi:hypothetical protein
MSIAEGMHLWKVEIKWQCWSVAGAVREPRYVLTVLAELTSRN